ncbi:hypothetical protein HPB49_010545 [Dermacentor silvarum]|uniref:Uncharacterized protein n=1 Tax=Dermacentor silvarum TaxID=543639 RepID=A0ACB8CWG3_DERSI|nr:hypothetical protein HPB49_010545 [Dermacentor silvarum]
MKDPMYFENYGEPLDFEVPEKGEKAVVPNYIVNLLSAITVLGTCAVVASVAVSSFRGSKGHHKRSASAVLLPEEEEPMDGWMGEWHTLMPSPRPIVCFVNREGFLRPPPDTLVLRHFPGFYCNEIVYDGLVFENATLQLLADATDDAILRQLNQIQDTLFPHWKVVVNVFVDGLSAKRMHENGSILLDSLFTWLERRRIDGLNFELDGNALLRDAGAALEVVSFFTSAYLDHRRGNLSLSAMLPNGATALFHEDLPFTLDRIFIKTHGLFNESSGTTQLGAPLDYADLTRRRSKRRTVLGLLEELEDRLSTKTCFTLALSGTAFTLRQPSQREVGDPVNPGPPAMASFSDVCAVVPGRIKRIEDDAAYTAENHTWVAHEDQFTVFEKAAKVLRHWRFLCVAAVDVDLDDVRGECGRTYPLLRRIYETSSGLKYP